MFVLARYLPYRESTERSNERQGATLSVRFSRNLSYRESTKKSKERQGPTLGVLCAGSHS